MGVGCSVCRGCSNDIDYNMGVGCSVGTDSSTCIDYSMDVVYNYIVWT